MGVEKKERAPVSHTVEKEYEFPVEKVWKYLKVWKAPYIGEATGMFFIHNVKGRGVGATRDAKDKDGNTVVTETLEDFDEKGMTYTYCFSTVHVDAMKEVWEGNAVKITVKSTGESTTKVTAEGLPLASKSKENIEEFKTGHTPFLEALYLNGKMETLLEGKPTVPEPVATPAPEGTVEIKVTTKKSANFYIRAVQSFLKGVEAKPAEEGKEAVEAKPAVELLRISGLGDAINVAVTAATQAESEGLGAITKIQTLYPPMEGSGRGCAQIVIDLKKK
eukprot:gnl/TRDRNA2_/TRDRNA2_171115_c0_seq2.p1 gnl/TRDRNA2_/TRDRNA2_171115_c0~~gnl/TRDRNA2_/TRDRNA2_171115_c0_seq2.p1  ORF type:complete len:277 (+),score=69.90 gnl/TRDRNA2_/TRDRNA2_171115_c0_seq2:89-919(+)